MLKELDTLDNVEDEYKEFFEKTDEDKFRFNRSKYDTAAQAAVNKKNRELLGKIGKYKDLDDADIERARKLKAKADKLGIFDEWIDTEDDEDHDKDKDKDKDKIDAKKLKREIQAELKKDYDAQLKLKDDAIAQKEAEFTRFRFKQELTALVSGSEDGLPVVLPERLKGFMSLNGDDPQFGFVDGKIVALDSDGEPDTETVNDRLKKLAEHPQWKYYFAAKEQGGGSGADKGGSRKHSGKMIRSKMTPKEKSDYIKEHGNDAFLKLPLK